MNSYPKFVKKKLDQCIQNLIWEREKFVRNPKSDFTRNRKLSLKSLIELIITMGVGSQNKELLEFFKYHKELPSASTLIQQRNKLKPSALQFVLQEFSNSISQTKKFRGYRLIAVDGSKIPIYGDPSDLETLQSQFHYCHDDMHKVS